MMKFTTTEGTQGICPKGSHIPSDGEWKQLELYLGMSQILVEGDSWRGTDEGGKLKLTDTTYWNSPNAGATNEVGFSARPGGWRNINMSGDILGVGSAGYWWTSTIHPMYDAYYRILSCDIAKIFRDPGLPNFKGYGYSVRCVMD